MFASVFVHQKTKSSRSYDYIIPANFNLSENQLVEVPFGNKKVLGLVNAIKLSSRLAKKEILRPISAGPVITSFQKKLALELSTRYMADLGAMLTGFVPSLNKKDYLRIGADVKISNRNNLSKRFLLIADRESRLTYYLQKLDRLKQNVIVLPTINQIQKVEKSIKKMRPELGVAIWHSGLDSKEKATLWQNLLENKNLVVIGTRHALFLPFTRLGSLIIDDPLNFAFQEDQSPYYNAYPVARMLSGITGCQLIVGEDSPDMISYTALLRNNLEIVDIKSPLKVTSSGSWGMASQNNDFHQKISTAINTKSRIAVVGPWRDQVRLICRDCKKESTCAKCNNIYFSQSSNICVTCGAPLSSTCNSCQSIKLDQVGFSYTNITKQINAFFPETRDNVTTDIKHLNEKYITILSPNEVELLQPVIDYFIFPFFDFMANSPRLGARQKLFRLIRELTAYSAKEVFIFGENFNDSEYISQIINNDWEAFLKNELGERRKLGLPPFTQSVLAVSRNKNVSLSKKHLGSFLDQLDKKILILPSETQAQFFVPHNFDFSSLTIPSSLHLEIDRNDLV